MHTGQPRAETHAVSWFPGAARMARAGRPRAGELSRSRAGPCRGRAQGGHRWEVALTSHHCGRRRDDPDAWRVSRRPRVLSGGGPARVRWHDARRVRFRPHGRGVLRPEGPRVGSQPPRASWAWAADVTSRRLPGCVRSYDCGWPGGWADLGQGGSMKMQHENADKCTKNGPKKPSHETADIVHGCV